MILYHGSKEIVEFPEIRTARYNKDFYFGFYCTQMPEQAIDICEKDFKGLCFVNLVDFDALWGHRRNVTGLL